MLYKDCLSWENPKEKVAIECEKYRQDNRIHCLEIREKKIIIGINIFAFFVRERERKREQTHARFQIGSCNGSNAMVEFLI